ncbi:MAG: hypothetical protein EHM70_08840, partial [Chloroflexota bacterium]
FKTTDGGKHWRQVDPMQGNHDQICFSALAYAPSDPNIVYADAGSVFMRSEDGGETWQVYNVGPDWGASSGENRGQPIALVVHPQDPNWLYMNAYDGGVFISKDGGRTWQDASRGYSGAQSWFIAVYPSDGAIAASASKNGIHLTKDGGKTWQGLITNGNLNNLTAVTFDPTSAATILLGTEINGSVWKTTDGGTSWRLVLGPLGEDVPDGRRAIYQIEFAPSNPRIVYTATGIDTMTVAIAEGANGPGVMKSTDGGDTWEMVNEGLEAANYNALDLAVHPQNENIVYLGTLANGVYKSVDGGASWLPANQGLAASEIRTIAIDPHNPETVFAGSGGSGVWKSTDGGASWAQVSVGLPPEANIFGLVFDPAQPGVVYAADRFSGVYASQDGGETWIRSNNGLKMRAVNELSISNDGQHLYAATEGNGVYRLDLYGVEPQPASIPTSTTQPSPVPARPTEITGMATTSQPEATSAIPTPTALPGQSNPVSTWLVYPGILVVLGMIALLISRRKKAK